MLNVAKSLEDLRALPNNRLEKLKGKLNGFHSLRINDQYRIIFSWSPPHADSVRIDDYH